MGVAWWRCPYWNCGNFANGVAWPRRWNDRHFVRHHSSPWYRLELALGISGGCHRSPANLSAVWRNYIICSSSQHRRAYHWWADRWHRCVLWVRMYQRTRCLWHGACIPAFHRSNLCVHDRHFHHGLRNPSPIGALA